MYNLPRIINIDIKDVIAIQCPYFKNRALIFYQIYSPDTFPSVTFCGSVKQLKLSKYLLQIISVNLFSEY